jgi:hypothetical protein
MNIITLKSSVNWCKHELHQLTPLVDNPNEEVYKFYTEYRPEILFHEITKLPIGISFHCGPILKVGEINPQIGKPLKEVCKGYDSAGNQTFMALVFEHDIPSNKETGIVSQ